jgi:hypothetical protein
MTGVAERIEIRSFAPERGRQPEWAPYRAATQEDEHRGRSRSSGFGMLTAFLLFIGSTVAVARGNATLSERFGISPESLLVAGWMIQGAAALFCFALAVRWLRSKSH